MPQTHPIQLLAIDLDGTLLTSSKQICDKAAEALLALPGRGIRVVIASARPPRSVRHFYRAMKLDTWQINYNGALIWDEPGRRVVDHCPLDGPLVRELIDEARRRFNEVVVACEILDRWYTDRHEQSHTTETGRLFRPDVVAPLEAFCDRPVTKLMLLGPERMISELEPYFAGLSSICAVRGDPDLIQIMNPLVSKATALRKVAGHYGVPLERVMAIGDAVNDIPMLEAAGAAVAMDNAPAAVKFVADWVAPSNNHHGVHAALERFGLI